MAFVSAQYGFRLNGNAGPQGGFSPPPAAAFAPPPLERTVTSSTLDSKAGRVNPNNIVNQKGGVNSSLYQSCLALKKRLWEVPGLEAYLEEMDEDERDSGDATDPVTSMWNMLRRGYPLMTIYNAFQPKVPLEVNTSRVTEGNLGKAATFKFLQACLLELQFPTNECFLVTDLYGQDTTGFVKVLKVINRVLDLLSERGLLHNALDNGADGDMDNTPRTHQQNVIQELVSSERDYVQHLETLQQFKNQLEQSGAIPGDVVHDIFTNLNALLDFQRRFLIRIEQQNSLSPSLQNWGQLFVQYQESGTR
jgi:cell division control protein 24